MGFKKFNFQIVLRIVLIWATSLWFGVEFGNRQKIYTQLVLAVLMLLQVYALIKYIAKIKTELYNYFLAFKDKSSSSTIPKAEVSKFGDLGRLINETVRELQGMRIESEQQFQLFRFVLNHVPIGLFAYNKKGEIVFSNSSFESLTGQAVSSIEALNKTCLSELITTLDKLNPGESQQVKIQSKNRIAIHLLKKAIFRFNKQDVQLISIQDVQAEFDEKELESWQKLIRVLTHEIMNSITPITNLTFAMKRCISKGDGLKSYEEMDTETIQDIFTNTDIIEERSKGLIKFVNNYQQLHKIARLELAEVDIRKLVEGVTGLFRTEIEEGNIDLRTKYGFGDMSYSVDGKLLEQALINLLKNAIEAVRTREQSRIVIEVGRTDQELRILISDNGKGISPDQLDKIFVPFYTTRKGGSGIGLSLVREIVQAHRGCIEVYSTPKLGTKFRILI